MCEYARNGIVRANSKLRLPRDDRRGHTKQRMTSFFLFTVHFVSVLLHPVRFGGKWPHRESGRFAAWPVSVAGGVTFRGETSNHLPLNEAYRKRVDVSTVAGCLAGIVSGSWLLLLLYRYLDYYN